MDEIIHNLENVNIISPKNIIDLKLYISKKYPDCSSKNKAVILADSINKIIDNSISCIDSDFREPIRKNLLQKAVQKENFSINGYDIVDQCMALSITEESFINSIVSWINTHQLIAVTKEKLYDYFRIPAVDEDTYYAAIAEKKTEYNEPIDEVVYTLENANEVNVNKENVLSDLITKLKESIIGLSSYKKASVFLLMFACVLIFTLSFRSKNGFGFNNNNIRMASANQIVSKEKEQLSAQQMEYEIYCKKNELDSEYRYKDINKEQLQEFLKSRNSILAKDEYVEKIITTAKNYDISPLLFVAITGQEQGFVPRTSKYANRIVNNPFNVYGSWKKFNTDISDSLDITARTIINLSRNKPVNVHQVKWINRKYAEDSKWWLGVNKIFKMLKQEIKE